jgi:hypothetical protein
MFFRVKNAATTSSVHLSGCWGLCHGGNSGWPRQVTRPRRGARGGAGRARRPRRAMLPLEELSELGSGEAEPSPGVGERSGDEANDLPNHPTLDWFSRIRNLSWGDSNISSVLARLSIIRISIYQMCIQSSSFLPHGQPVYHLMYVACTC